MSDYVTKRQRRGVKVSLKLVVDAETRELAERVARERGLRYAGRGNLSALFAALVHEAAKGGAR